ncbi:MAG TPA: AAA-like domain-containing protein [Saprospiraceae bacterium]|nr:AAA-like domain-containing protein [Saprospiraceae bacterium]HMQ85740.1 AAA-like domain-containing protein [Saprospiraceae bacterium]
MTQTRYFNTSGPNFPEEHYTIERHKEIQLGRQLVNSDRYFTIWAPRQTGKSTYFRQLAAYLEKEGYSVAHLNFENYKQAPESSFLKRLHSYLAEHWQESFDGLNIGDVFLKIEQITDKRFVLIIDEVEGINPEYFGTFLHAIRNVYHSRKEHALKSVILVGVSNILGVVSDNASPFNIADNLEVPYFTETEVQELLGQHEAERGQLFEQEVKNKIYQITAGQPGLVNGFAQKLITNYPDATCLTMAHYLQVEDWYLNQAIDKNFENILNKARQERAFVERLLFTEDQIPFSVDRPAIKLLYTNGLIRRDEAGNVTFWVPFYKKRLYNAFYPYTNGEKTYLLRSMALSQLFDEQERLQLDALIEGYKSYVKRRGFNVFREKDAQGEYTSIRESALIYSFETYIQAFLQVSDSKSYREAHTGLGRSDLVINARGNEYLIETKIYYYEKQFLKGKKQLAYYCKSLGLKQGVYLVFCPNNISYPPSIIESKEQIEGIAINTYLVEYDEEKWD